MEGLESNYITDFPSDVLEHRQHSYPPAGRTYQHYPRFDKKSD